ncbi:hypothetical protein [Burkholderia cepacia]|uniref:hypothetical protein n=1 Tax=Burkholderia cepacia TaxID=292 RepID=UPI00158BCFBC|nr:hypothetical protein [Burkholderia cepacia]
MGILAKIRRMYFREKVPLREIARRTGLSRNTVRSWLRQTDAVEPKYPKRVSPSVVDEWAAQLTGWLRADSHRPKRDRRMARFMFEAIRGEGYAGSYPAYLSVVADAQEIARHERSFERHMTFYDWRHYITLVERKPGALRNGAPFVTMPQPLQQLQRHLLKYPGGDRIMTQVLAAVREHGLDAVLLAVQAALDSGRPSGEHVLNVLSRLKAPTTSANLATTKLQLTEEPAADVSRYETLRANPPENRHV